MAYTEFYRKSATSRMEMDEIIMFLNEDFQVRTNKEVICEAVGIFQHKKRIAVSVDEAVEILTERMPDENPDNIKRWLGLTNNKETKEIKDSGINRDNLIQIAFALDMNLEDTELLLRLCMYDALYMRDVKDAIYACALTKDRDKWNYSDVKTLIHEFSSLDIANVKPKTDEDIQEDSLTKALVDEIADVSCPNDLRDYLNHRGHLFGSFHRRTHKHFLKMYESIKKDIEQQELGVEPINDALAKSHGDIGEEEFNNKKARTRLDPVTKKKVGLIISDEQALLEICMGIHDMRKRGMKTTTQKILAKSIPGRPEFSELLDAEEIYVYKSSLRSLIDIIIPQEENLLGFIAKLKKNGYTVKDENGALSVRGSGRSRFTSLDGLGSGYTREDIIKRINGETLNISPLSIREVSRNLFILTWLSTKRGDIEYYLERRSLKPSVAFRTHIRDIDMLLQSHGMPILDPRYPLDWALMNSLRYVYHEHRIDEDSFVNIPERLKKLFDQINKMEDSQ